MDEITRNLCERFKEKFGDTKFYHDVVIPFIADEAKKAYQKGVEDADKNMEDALVKAIHSVEDFRSHHDPDDLYMELQDILKSVEATLDKKAEV